ncbi:MAG: hypothetical protein QM753_16690 [Thermomicrobiales bacterium]
MEHTPYAGLRSQVFRLGTTVVVGVVAVAAVAVAFALGDVDAASALALALDDGGSGGLGWAMHVLRWLADEFDGLLMIVQDEFAGWTWG